MRRRSFLAGLVGVAAAPLAAEGQQAAKTYRIGVVTAYSGEDDNPAYSLREGLRELGYSEGQNIAIEWRWARGDAARYPILAGELARFKLDVIVAGNNAAVHATQSATKTTPIVMVLATDPIGLGFAASLSRPGGNITGLTTIQREITAKRLQLLTEAIPSLLRVAVLWDPTEPGRRSEVKEAELAARALGLRLQFVEVRNPGDLDAGFADAAGAQAMLVQTSTMLFAQRARIAELATKRRLPTMVPVLTFAMSGCLMAYGPRSTDLYRRAAGYVDKILKGAKPGDLPIEQPTKFELVINLKTAKALGVTIPQSLLLRADQVIE